MSALLRLIHGASLLAGLSDDCRTANAQPEQPTGEFRGVSARDSGPFCAGLGATVVHLPLSPENAAPILVVGDGHPAFDANPHPLPRLGIPGKELLQERHGVSVSTSTLRRISAPEGLLNVQNSAFQSPRTAAEGIIRDCSTAARVSAHQCTVYVDEDHGTPDR